MVNSHALEVCRALGALVLGVAIALVLGVPERAEAVPRMSLTAGTPCEACHVNIQGGGMRTEIGWGSMAYVGALTYDQIGLDSLAELESNAYFDSRVAAGIDLRMQLARLGAPVIDARTQETVVPDRVFIPMQIQPYLSVAATDWLKFYGTYNIGPSVFRGQGFCEPVFPGQSCFLASALVQPTYEWPTFRLGQIQPSIGIRHDDHTMLLRADAAAPRIPIIAPNYAELGAELSYHPLYWFQTEAGVFRSANLAEVINDEAVVDSGDVAFLGRIQFQPRFDLSDSFTLTSWIGTSLFGAGRFNYQSYFVGLGWLGWASLQFELSRSERGLEADYDTFNGMVHMAVTPWDWITLEGRVGRATTDISGDESEAMSYVAGVQFFPIPFVEIRPEYRRLVTDSYILAQYTVQLHLFY